MTVLSKKQLNQNQSEFIKFVVGTILPDWKVIMRGNLTEINLIEPDLNIRAENDFLQQLMDRVEALPLPSIFVLCNNYGITHTSDSQWTAYLVPSG